MAENTDANQEFENPKVDDNGKDDYNQGGYISADNSFSPVLYNFRVAPHSVHGYALQLPFTVLFDNLIAVVWSTYTKEPTIKIGINQIQWALEFMKCMRVEHRYPESIGEIVKELEKRLIILYAKVSGILQERKLKEEQEEKEREEKENANNESKMENEVDPIRLVDCSRVSYNEDDVMKKLYSVNVPIDSVTGEAKSLRELNALGGRRSNTDAECVNKKASSKTLLIGELQNIKIKTNDQETKTEVEHLIKKLKIHPKDSGKK